MGPERLRNFREAVGNAILCFLILIQWVQLSLGYSYFC